MASYDGDEDSGGGSRDIASSVELVAEVVKIALQGHSLDKVDKDRIVGGGRPAPCRFLLRQARGQACQWVPREGKYVTN
jgi:hypothetical protein